MNAAIGRCSPLHRNMLRNQIVRCIQRTEDEKGEEKKKLSNALTKTNHPIINISALINEHR